MRFHNILTLAFTLGAMALPQPEGGSSISKRNHYNFITQIYRGSHCDGDLLQYFSGYWDPPSGDPSTGCINVGAVASSVFLDVPSGAWYYTIFPGPDCNTPVGQQEYYATQGTNACIFQSTPFQSVYIDNAN